MTYGATPEQWAHFDLVLGLGADLLPVVSNPKATISPRSTMKKLGKTPSLYNGGRMAVGIQDWTSHQASGQELDRWAREADYGICIQTRAARALDVDVADPVRAAQIGAAFCGVLGLQPPTRFREGTGKCLLAFTMAGRHAKRVLRTEGGVVEFLGDGQQFVAIGSHESGTSYRWLGGLPEALPEITPEQFEAAWSTLAMLFAVEEPKTQALTTRRKGQHLAVEDPVADHLEAQGLVLGEQDNGGLLVACPWSAEHTGGEDGDGSTVWFRAGTNGYPKGHFRCLHAHCEGRHDGLFFEGIGYAEDIAGEFQEIAPAVVEGSAEASAEKPLPSFERDKTGRILATIGNLTKAIARPDMTGYTVGYDTFRDEIMRGPGGTDGWERFTDVDYVKLRITLEARSFLPIGREMIRDAVEVVARRQAFDSAALWLEHKAPAWDGVPRVEGFVARYWGAADDAYTRAVGRYIWTALAGRVLDAGCKADMVPILVGEQGCGKSTAIMAMAPALDVFAEISFHEKEDDLARKIKGKLVIEIGELRGLHTRELESIKAYITRQHEQWVPKYKEFATHYPRRCIFFGTTNNHEFLADETGNRRWLPVVVGQIDVAGIARERDQLWAEGRALWLAGGVDFGVERMASEAHAEHMIEDPWIEPIRCWLTTPDDAAGEAPLARGRVQISEISELALGLDVRRAGSKRDQMKIGELLRGHFKMEKRKVRDGRKTFWAYVFPPSSHLIVERMEQTNG